jgi:ubiquinone/menaquinone biosynthesis C-methylase UbiE
VKQSFAKSYFDNKSGESLRRTISPNWDSTETQLRLLDVPKSAKFVLEVGCGMGRLLREIALMPGVKHCWGYDASEAMIREAPHYCEGLPVTFELCEGDYFPLPAYKVDFAFAWLVFQHIEDQYTVHRYAEKMARSLKSRGRVKIQLLASNERPGNPLWVWHDPNMIEFALLLGDCRATSVQQITDRWIIVEGRK